NISSYLINPKLLVNATLPTNVSNVYVDAGDHIYFRVNTSQLPDGEVTVNWDPRVEYTTGSVIDNSSFSESFLYGDVEATPLTIRDQGQYRVEWSPASLNLPTGIQLKVTVYTLDPNNLQTPKTNVITPYIQTVTNSLTYQPSAVTFYAGSN